MPDIATHAAAHAATTTYSTAASMISLAAIGQMLGIDYVALFYAFMGAICWRAVQPKIDKRLDEISRAFGWAVMGMILGTLGAILIESIASHYFPFLEKLGHAQIIGLPALLLGFACQPIILKSLSMMKEWKKANA